MSGYLSADGFPVTVGAKFWDNNLRVVEVVTVAAFSNPYADTGETQTWHNARPGGAADTLSGTMRPWGRLAKFYEGVDAERFPPGTNWADVR